MVRADREKFSVDTTDGLYFYFLPACLTEWNTDLSLLYLDFVLRDKFAVFEEWLRVNGTKFDKLELKVRSHSSSFGCPVNALCQSM